MPTLHIQEILRLRDWSLVRSLTGDFLLAWKIVAYVIVGEERRQAACLASFSETLTVLLEPQTYNLSFPPLLLFLLFPLFQLFLRHLLHCYYFLRFSPPYP